MQSKNLFYLMICTVCVVVFCSVGSVAAKDKKDMGGWGVDDPYNEIYDANDVEKLKVVVIAVKEVIPLPGMTSGVALVVKEGNDGDELLVHLCPVSYKKANRMGIKKGDKITLRGYFSEINDEEVIMAAKIKNKGKSIKFRLTSDGTPFWTMSPAQLQKELSSQ